jgi:hypothetical protein
MNKDFCVVLFSHADNLEKEEILFNSLTSIRKLNLKVILASHIPVSERNQNLCDYFIKDDNNLIIDESEIFNNPIDIDTNLFSSIDYFGGIRFETYIYKKTYQAGVFNLYISSFNLAKNIGFKNVILWEYDYTLGDDSIDFIKNNMKLMIEDKLESISFESTITIFNSDVVQSDIYCCYAIPVFFNLDRFLSNLSCKLLETGKEYVELSRLMIMEQWVKSNIIENCNPRIEYLYGDYVGYLPDTISGQVHSQSNNYLLSGLRSGIYFNDENACVVFNNSSNSLLKSSIFIYNEDDNLYSSILELNIGVWFYDFLDKSILDLMKTDLGCKVIEVVEDLESGKTDTFEYVINKNNIHFVSKLKRYSI